MLNPKFTTGLFLLWLLLGSSAWGQAGGDRLQGTWLREDKQNYKIRIERNGADYRGKIIWMKEPLDDQGNPRRDAENPDVNLRDRPLMGLTILKDFHYDGKDRWRDGRLYHFSRGNEYNAQIELVEKDRLKLVISFWFLTRTYYWCRVDL